MTQAAERLASITAHTGYLGVRSSGGLPGSGVDLAMAVGYLPSRVGAYILLKYTGDRAQTQPVYRYLMADVCRQFPKAGGARTLAASLAITTEVGDGVCLACHGVGEVAEKVCVMCEGSGHLELNDERLATVIRLSVREFRKIIKPIYARAVCELQSWESEGLHKMARLLSEDDE